MSKNRKFMMLFSICGIAAACLIYCGGARVASKWGTENKRECIVVDAGHGSPDGGAVGADGTFEKDINLSIAKKLQEVLEGKGVEVVMTRSGDDEIYDSSAGTIREKKVSDMKNRVKIINDSNALCYISIHMNSFDDKRVSGLNVYYSGDDTGREIAELIEKSIAEVTGVEYHTVRTIDERLYLSKHTKIPAVLVECGFISNPEEEKKLNDSDYQARLAWAIAEAVEDYIYQK